MSVQDLAVAVSQELQRRLPKQRKTQREALGTLVATMLDVRSPNTVDLASGVPREAERLDMRLQWVSRVLSNPHIDAGQVMSPFVRQLLSVAGAKGQTLVISIDQSKVSDRFQMLMVSLRYQERALPLAWCVADTQGGIVFKEQKALLERIHQELPTESKVVLMGDRFYGMPDLIEWCQKHQWGWRLRLKQKLIFWEGSKKHSLGDLVTDKPCFKKDVCITRKAVCTHIGVVHEKGHKEPWIIAMSDPPDYYKTMDYGMRWGIECMFSDLKSRGFSLEETQLRYADRVERLVLIMALALYFAVSCGEWDKYYNPMPYEKKLARKQPAA